MTKLIWVGIRESDIDFTGDLFDFSITYYGKCKGNNVSYYNGGYHSMCTKKEFIIEQLQNIGLTPEYKVMFYNPSMAYSVLEDFPELSTHLVGLCSSSILEILNDKIQTRVWMSKHVNPPSFSTLFKEECSFNNLKNLFFIKGVIEMKISGLEGEKDGKVEKVQADKVLIHDSILLGYQDTVEFFTGRQMVENSLIAGATDFIFGSDNTTYFYNCEIRSILTAGDVL